MAVLQVAMPVNSCTIIGDRVLRIAGITYGTDAIEFSLLSTLMLTKCSKLSGSQILSGFKRLSPFKKIYVGGLLQLRGNILDIKQVFVLGRRE